MRQYENMLCPQCASSDEFFPADGETESVGPIIEMICGACGKRGEAHEFDAEIDQAP